MIYSLTLIRIHSQFITEIIYCNIFIITLNILSVKVILSHLHNVIIMTDIWCTVKQGGNIYNLYIPTYVIIITWLKFSTYDFDHLFSSDSQPHHRWEWLRVNIEDSGLCGLVPAELTWEKPRSWWWISTGADPLHWQLGTSREWIFEHVVSF